VAKQKVAGLAGLIMILGVLIPAFSAGFLLWEARPMVEYRIDAFDLQGPPKVLDFRLGSRVSLVFQLRNRGATDAPVFVNITVANARIGTLDQMNNGSIIFWTLIAAHSDQYGGWEYYITAIGDPESITITFDLTREWKTDLTHHQLVFR